MCSQEGLCNFYKRANIGHRVHLRKTNICFALELSSLKEIRAVPLCARARVRVLLTRKYRNLLFMSYYKCDHGVDLCAV